MYRSPEMYSDLDGKTAAQGVPGSPRKGQTRLRSGVLYLPVVLMLASLFTALCLMATSETGEAYAQEEGFEKTCPENTVCLAIPGFRTATGFPPEKEKIFEAATSDILRVALLRYPGILPISSGDLWRALRATYESPKDWTTRNLSRTEVLHRAGANYVLDGTLYERRGAIQITARVTSLSEENRWRSKTLRSELYPEQQFFRGVSSFAGAVVEGLATDDILDYRTRSFVVTPFCDSSQHGNQRIALYARDLPEALTEQAKPVNVAKMRYLEHEPCVGRDEAHDRAVKYAANGPVDGLVTGVVKLREETGSLSVVTDVFIPELDLWRRLPLKYEPESSYLEQKYTTLDLFELFLKAALTDNGRWEKDFLDVPRERAELLARIDEFIDRGNLPAAEFLVFETLVREPSSAETHHRLGLIRFQQRQLERAVEQQKEAVRQRADFPEAYGALGDALVALKKYEEAENAYRQQTRLDPESVDGYLALASVARFRGKNEESMDWLRGVLRLERDNDTARNRLADLYDDRADEHIDQKEYKAAYQDYNRALEIDPSADADRYYHRAYAFARAVIFKQIDSASGYGPAIEDYRKALESHEKGERLGPGRVAGSYLNRQELHLLDGDYEDAIQIARKFLRSAGREDGGIDADDELITRSHMVVALILSDKNYEQALRELRQHMGSVRRITSTWSFDLVDEYLEARQTRLSTEKLQAIREIKEEVEAKLRTR